MQKTDNIHAQVSKRIQECLKELGFDPETRIAEHEGLVTARKQMDDKCVRIVAHVTDREGKTSDVGQVASDVARMRRAQVAVRPTLANRSASRGASAKDVKEGCE
jgi:hypothetical protein